MLYSSYNTNYAVANSLNLRGRFNQTRGEYKPVEMQKSNITACNVCCLSYLYSILILFKIPNPKLLVVFSSTIAQCNYENQVHYCPLFNFICLNVCSSQEQCYNELTINTFLNQSNQYPKKHKKLPQSA